MRLDPPTSGINCDSVQFKPPLKYPGECGYVYSLSLYCCSQLTSVEQNSAIEVVSVSKGFDGVMDSGPLPIDGVLSLHL